MRKDQGFELTDKISVVIDTNETLKNSLTVFKDYICAEILAENLYFQAITDDNGIEIDVNENILKTIVSKKG
ncbi:DUF5915 domain-containing protein [Niabella sp. W65]|nr:DUF5915 domain-containing protein [Niabella sp. W65]MCH7367474.1 DUF5915 domain-containing protein [Niabella sp. W65]